MRKDCTNCAYSDGWIKGFGDGEYICPLEPEPERDSYGDCEEWKVGKKLTPNDPIYIIDLETTGLDGYPTDAVVEVGIARYDQIGGRVEPVYGRVINVPGIRERNAKTVDCRRGTRGCWVFNNTSLTIEDVENSEYTLDKVVGEVRSLLLGQFVTSYNIGFDFGSFLDYPPWSLYEIAYPTKDIMDVATQCVKKMAEQDAIEDKSLQRDLLDDWERRPDRWLRSEVAYRILCPDDPAGINMKQTHRALDDAVMEGWIMSRATRMLATDIFMSLFTKTLGGVE